jgi:hypothetical protein
LNHYPKTRARPEELDDALLIAPSTMTLADIRFDYTKVSPSMTIAVQLADSASGLEKPALYAQPYYAG